MNTNKIYCHLLPGTETTGKVTMMITPVTRSTIQGTVIVITTGAVGIALALILHHVSIVIVVYIDPILHCWKVQHRNRSNMRHSPLICHLLEQQCCS